LSIIPALRMSRFAIGFLYANQYADPNAVTTAPKSRIKIGSKGIVILKKPRSSLVPNKDGNPQAKKVKITFTKRTLRSQIIFFSSVILYICARAGGCVVGIYFDKRKF
jgi:hypothetical protein